MAMAAIKCGAALLVFGLLPVVAQGDDAVAHDSIRQTLIPAELGHPITTKKSPDVDAMSAVLPTLPNTTDNPHYAPSAPMPMVQLFGSPAHTLGALLASVGAATGYHAVFFNPADRNLKVGWIPQGRVPLSQFLLVLGHQVDRDLPMTTDGRLIEVMPEVSHGQ